MLSYIKLTLFIQYASHLPTDTLFAVREQQGGRRRTATLPFAFSSVADGERQITQQESVGNTYYDTALIITIHKSRSQKKRAPLKEALFTYLKKKITS